MFMSKILLDEKMGIQASLRAKDEYSDKKLR